MVEVVEDKEQCCLSANRETHQVLNLIGAIADILN